MPIEVGIWRLGKQAEKVDFIPMPSEDRLEGILAGDISILDPNLLLIGRQVPTSFGKVIAVDMSDPPGHFMLFAKLHKGGLTDEKRSRRGIQNPFQMDSS